MILCSQLSEEDIRNKYAIHLERYEKTHMGGFRKIYPNHNEELYEKFFDQRTSLCAETAASRARCELSRIQREDIEAKQRELENMRKRFCGGKTSTTGNSNDVRPESPSSEKRTRPKGLPIKRRIPNLRIPLYTSRAGFKTEASETPCAGRESRQLQYNMEEADTVRSLRFFQYYFDFALPFLASGSLW